MLKKVAADALANGLLAAANHSLGDSLGYSVATKTSCRKLYPNLIHSPPRLP
jgi:hypothetical protein